ncbi:MAG TPA: hypothetical protein VD927_00515 [Chryseosolibacter sp.]|nr:hypothetical protein [Chryseosolibacter sp.]
MKKFFQKGILMVVLAMVLTVPNLKLYAYGQYQQKSAALEANANQTMAVAEGDAFWPAVLAVAAGVGLAVVFAVGVVDGWNSIHAESVALATVLESKYDSNDFSKYDN